MSAPRREVKIQKGQSNHDGRYEVAIGEGRRMRRHVKKLLTHCTRYIYIYMHIHNPHTRIYMHIHNPRTRIYTLITVIELSVRGSSTSCTTWRGYLGFFSFTKTRTVFFAYAVMVSVSTARGLWESIRSIETAEEEVDTLAGSTVHGELSLCKGGEVCERNNM